MFGDYETRPLRQQTASADPIAPVRGKLDAIHDGTQHCESCRRHAAVRICDGQALCPDCGLTIELRRERARLGRRS